METLITDLEKQLTDQRLELATSIKHTEEALMRTKEGFWQVEGGREIINIIKTRLAAESKESEVVEEVVGTSWWLMNSQKDVLKLWN